MTPIPPSPPVARSLPDVIAQIKIALEGKWGYRPTPGPWFGSFDAVYEGEDRDSRTGTICRSSSTRGKTELEEINNVYIAACNPENMRALLSAISAHEAEVGRLRKLAADALDFMNNIDPDESFNPPTASWAKLLTHDLGAALTQGETK